MVLSNFKVFNAYKGSHSFNNQQILYKENLLTGMNADYTYRHGIDQPIYKNIRTLRNNLIHIPLLKAASHLFLYLFFPIYIYRSYKLLLFPLLCLLVFSSLREQHLFTFLWLCNHYKLVDALWQGRINASRPTIISGMIFVLLSVSVTATSRPKSQMFSVPVCVILIMPYGYTELDRTFSISSSGSVSGGAPPTRNWYSPYSV